MKVRTFVISAIFVCVVLILFGVIAVKDSKKMYSEDIKRDSIYSMVDSLSDHCSKMDSIIKVQDQKIELLMSAQSKMKEKIKDNNRLANNAIKGLALKYTLDYYGY